MTQDILLQGVHTAAEALIAALDAELELAAIRPSEFETDDLRRSREEAQLAAEAAEKEHNRSVEAYRAFILSSGQKAHDIMTPNPDPIPAG